MFVSSFEYSGLKFEGLSLAGVRTSLALPQHSLAFDLAQGLPHAIGMNTFLLTHGHMDHSAGVPYVISQKAMNSHVTPRFIMPTEMLEPMTEIMNQWSLIEGHTYEFQFIGARPAETFPLDGKLFIKSFETVHRIPSLGYSLYRRSRKLRQDLTGRSSEEIAEIRKRGEDPTEEKTDLLVSFTGDTQIEVFERSPEILKSKILIIEATYLDERKSIESARDWGHIHLSELLSRLPQIESEKILLIHSSARYSFEEAKSILEKRLPAHEKERVILFPGR